jgi:D-arabinose 5-phosphate isomerase GutQ
LPKIAVTKWSLQEEKLATSDNTRILRVGRARVRAEVAALAKLDSRIDESLADAVRVILACRGKVICAGLGTSGMMARRLAHLLSVSGTPAVFLHPSDGLHGGLGAIADSDVVISISKGGQTLELNEFTRRAKSRGSRIIVLTGEIDNELAGLGDVTARLPTPTGADPGGVLAMGSTLIVGAWGDALASALMDARDYEWSEVLLSHPGGAVGQLSKSDIMLDEMRPSAAHELKDE